MPGRLEAGRARPGVEEGARRLLRRAFCLASDTDWQVASITHATVQQMMVRGLVEHEGSATRYRLIEQARAVLEALLRP